MSLLPVQASYVEAGDLEIFYRHASPTGPSHGTILLLHGFPSSSHQFRNLIPLLASYGYLVLALDLPGYGFTTLPEGYVHNFANLSKALEKFTEALNLQKFAIYIFDYGAPAGLRFALNHPEQIAAIVSQNGNAYMEGFGEEFWVPIRKYWDSGSIEDRNALKPALKLDSIKWQYTNGSPHPKQIQPESYYLDHTLVHREGNTDVQLDLLYDYRTNVPLYPSFQQYFRSSQVPILAIWGKNDDIFIPPGAEAFKRDVKNFQLQYLDAGHFAIETNEELVAGSIHKFFKKFGVFD